MTWAVVIAAAIAAVFLYVVVRVARWFGVGR